MTIHVSSETLARDSVARPARAWIRPSLAGLAIAGLFLLARPYQGIVHDAILYVGRALANLDPDGIGRDLSFATDGQSRFSIYPRALTSLTSAFGPAAAAMTATALGLALWLTALTALVRTIARGPASFAMLALVAMSTLPYGGFNVFRFAESFATPRSLAEAGVIAGLAALMSGRRTLAISAMAAAAIVHPIMAAPGVAVLALALCASDRRWILPLAGVTTAVLAAGALRLPFADRLFTIYDPAWRAVIASDVYLFPSQWPAAGWERLAVAVATIALGIRVVGEPLRRMLGAILIVALGGVLVAWLLGDCMAVVLVVQAQPWRSLWLGTLAAPLVLPLVCHDLWSRGSAGRAALAVLALAWIDFDFAVPALATCAALLIIDKRRPDAISGRVVVAVWLAAAAGAIGIEYLRFVTLWEAIESAPPGGRIDFTTIWRTQIIAQPIGVAILAWFVAGRRRVPTPALAAFAFVALAGSLSVLDDRGKLDAQVEQGAPDPALTRLLPPGQRPILVLDSPKLAWFLAGRRNWASRVQSAGLIFSRPLALDWRASMIKLETWSLTPPNDPPRWDRHVALETLRPSMADLNAICREPDGPGALVLPLSDELELPFGLSYAVWTPPAPDLRFTADAARPWIGAARFAVVTCSTLARG